tara:strand:- start:495 stop:1361 length:867 start_codon:yes stop_codon:yes gene_type:complete
MSKILVTGGAGFIGNVLINKLLSDGHEVTSFDRTKHYTERFNVNEVYGDIQDSYSVDCYVKDHDYIFNIAGMLGTQETVNDPIPTVNINIVGSINVFNACKRHHVKCTHISVGNWWMNNPYSISKSTSERFALMFNKEHKTKITVIRGLNVYGPGQKSYPVKKIMPTFIKSALTDEDIIVYGDGNQKMDMIYIDDMAHILKDSMKSNIFDKVIDGGTGVAPTVNDIAEKVIKYSKSKSKIKHVKMRPGEESNSIVVAKNINLLRTFYEQNFTSLDDGIKLTIDNYKKV